jgi:acyl carrier protein
VTRDAVAAVIRSILAGIAPEADLARVKPGADLRDELDIDSMDFLRFVVELQTRLGVSVPEKDYPRIRTLDACVAYVAERTAPRAGDAATPVTPA